jgi:protein TonB
VNAARNIPAFRRRPEALRWGICFALTLCFHVAGAAALMARWTESSDLVANAPLIMIDFAPLPVAPEITPNELPPGPRQTQAQPEPQPPQKALDKVELPPEPQAAPLPQPTPPPKPVEKLKEKTPKQKHASLASAPSTAEHRAARAAAPMPGTASRDPDALPNWKSQLVARLERFKRYPPEAQARGEQGVAQLAFSIDRSGAAHHARIVRSTGSSLLDRETLALVERAAPLPPPPADVPGAQIAVVVPIRYNFH